MPGLGSAHQVIERFSGREDEEILGREAGEFQEFFALLILRLHNIIFLNLRMPGLIDFVA